MNISFTIKCLSSVSMIECLIKANADPIDLAIESNPILQSKCRSKRLAIQFIMPAALFLVRRPTQKINEEKTIQELKRSDLRVELILIRKQGLFAFSLSALRINNNCRRYLLLFFASLIPSKITWVIKLKSQLVDTQQIF